MPGAGYEFLFFQLRYLHDLISLTFIFVLNKSPAWRKNRRFGGHPKQTNSAIAKHFMPLDCLKPRTFSRTARCIRIGGACRARTKKRPRVNPLQKNRNSWELGHFFGKGPFYERKWKSLSFHLVVALGWGCSYNPCTPLAPSLHILNGERRHQRIFLNYERAR